MPDETGRVVVTRSPLRAWVVAVLGIPFLVLGVGLVTESELVRAIGRVVYGGGEGLPGPEWRDVVWGWVFVVAGGAVTLWGLVQLVRPSRLLAAGPEGIGLAVTGPLRRRLHLEWDQVVGLRPVRVRDADGELPALALVVKDPGSLPERPWGARRADRWTLVVLAEGWSVPPAVVAERLEAVRPEP